MKAAERKLLIGLAILFALTVLALVGIDDTALEQQQYCNNVREGVWPDYAKTYKDECGGEEPPKFNEDLTK